ncbi:MAG: GIY-YIG nuclease family protein [Bacteroidetes bacterium]|nr:GIY-YIG nuclease family protein [Bacteroidota bacterium]
MYTVYAITSKSRKYIYVGLTSDLERRLKQHNNGYEKTTKPYAPFILIYKEIVSTRIEARKREKYWKSGIGKEKLKAMIVESAGLSTDR